jgi:phosphate-selective porin OprO/OprP
VRVTYPTSIFVLVVSATQPSFAQDPRTAVAGLATEEAPRADPPVEGEPPTTAVSFEPGKGVRITSDDDEFELRLGLRAQVLDAVLAEEGEDVENELTLRRARLTLKGHAFGEHNHFALQLGLAPADLGIRNNVADSHPAFTPILDLYFEFTHLRELEIRAGQFKIPFSRTRLTSSGNLALVDRSLADDEFSVDRDVGLMLGSSDFLGADLLRYRVGAFSGRGRDARGLGEPSGLLAARLELFPFGIFDDLTQGDLDRGGPRVGLGAAYAFQYRAPRDRGPRGAVPADGGTTDVQHVTADLAFAWEGLSVIGEFFARTGERTSGGALDEMGVPIPTASARNGYGLGAHVGYVMPFAPIEIVARYSAILGDGDQTAIADEHEIGGGLNWYIERHAYKLQADYFHLTGPDVPSADRIRVQLQGSL